MAATFFILFVFLTRREVTSVCLMDSFRRRPNKASVHSARYDWNEIFYKASPHALFTDISHVIQMTLSNDDIMLMFP